MEVESTLLTSDISDLVLYRLSRPRRIRKEMEGFFRIQKSKISTGITCMIHAMHALGVSAVP